MAKAPTKDERFKTFVEKSTEVHSGKYDYSKSTYENSATKIIIICPEHGDFVQRPNDHVNGAGCPECKKVSLSKNRRKTLEDFIKESIEVHGDKYNYSKSKYITTDDKIEIICPDHGSFFQVAYTHLNGTGCPTCWKIRQSLMIIDRNKMGILNTSDVLSKFNSSFRTVEAFQSQFPPICDWNASHCSSVRRKLSSCRPDSNQGPQNKNKNFY